MSETLKKRHRAILCEIIQDNVPDAEIFLFGSHARGTAIPSSDVDIAIRADAPLDSNLLTRLSMAFSESDLPFSVDIIDMRTTGPEFLSVIKQDAISLCKKPSKFIQTTLAHPPT